MKTAMNDDDEDAVFTDEDFAAAAEAEAEARSNAAEEDAYIASIEDPEERERREDQRWLRRARRVVVLGDFHQAVFVSSSVEGTLHVFSEDSMQELEYFDPEPFNDEQLKERLWTRINFG